MTEVLILGAGIAGLAAAAALAARGHKVRVIERAPALTEVGAGIQLSPNGVRVLRALGLGRDLDRVGRPGGPVTLRHDRTARPVARLDSAARHPGGFFYIHRADLIDLLAGACAGAGVSLDLGVQIARVGADWVDDSQGRRHSAPLIVGADGVRSLTRKLLNPGDQPFFTGQVAWRALVPGDAARPGATVWMGPGRHVVSYTLRSGLTNLVIVREQVAWQADGWALPGDADAMRAAFADVHPDLAKPLSAVEDCYLWGLHRYDVAGTWVSPGLALVGDAAHPTLPFLAQGANQALEDAWVLADCLGQGTQDQALRRYQTLRQPRVTRVIAAANGNARNFHLSGWQARAAHLALRTVSALAPSLLASRYDWIYGYDATQAAR